MSFSTFSCAQPSIAVAAPPAPRTLRKSRRFTPGSLVNRRSSSLVVTRRAIVARAKRGIRLADVTVHAPAHVERVLLIDLLHILDLPVTGLALHAGVHVTHVRKMNVFGKLVDANPRHRLLVVPERGELFDLRLAGRDE